MLARAADFTVAVVTGRDANHDFGKRLLPCSRSASCVSIVLATWLETLLRNAYIV